MSKVGLRMALGQLMDSAEVRAAQFRGDDEYTEVDFDTADFIEECVQVVQFFLDDFKGMIERAEEEMYE